MTEGDKKRPGLGGDVRDGIRAGIGILAAMKDAIEETIQDLVEGDRDAEQEPESDGADHVETPPAGGVDAAVDAAKARARAAGRAAAQRLDVATREELQTLRAEVAELRDRVKALEDGPSAPPEA